MVSEKYIAARIKELRKSAGLDVDAVGRGVGRSGKTVSAWETGRNVPSADMLIKICKFFKVNISYFYPPEVSFVEDAEFGVMTADEKEIVYSYRRMVDDDKKSFISIARTLACAGDLKKGVSYGVVELAGDDVM